MANKHVALYEAGEKSGKELAASWITSADDSEMIRMYEALASKEFCAGFLEGFLQEIKRKLPSSQEE